MDLEDGELCQRKLVNGTSSDPNLNYIQVNALIKSINQRYLKAIYYELGNNIFGFSNVFTDIFPLE